MDRRTAIRTLASVSVLPVLVPERASELLDARRVIVAAERVSTSLSQSELEIVGLVADIILPRTDSPSATDLDVPAFVDLIVSEWMGDKDSEDFRLGLRMLDTEAAVRFGIGFIESSADQQHVLVSELDTQMPAPSSSEDVPDGFYPTLKRLVVVGYFTTEEGASQTGYRITPGTYLGCSVPGANQ